MPIKRVFLDTNGWIALLNASDALHVPAEARWKRILEEGYEVFLTDWIIAETGNGLARTSARSRFPRAVEIFRLSPRVRLIHVDEHLFERSLALYGSRSDKTWGLVDCASFLIMESERIQEVMTNDQHFKQAGFRCLLPLA